MLPLFILSQGPLNCCLDPNACNYYPQWNPGMDCEYDPSCIDCFENCEYPGDNSCFLYNDIFLYNPDLPEFYIWNDECQCVMDVCTDENACNTLATVDLFWGIDLVIDEPIFTEIPLDCAYAGDSCLWFNDNISLPYISECGVGIETIYYDVLYEIIAAGPTSSISEYHEMVMNTVPYSGVYNDNCECECNLVNDPIPVLLSNGNFLLDTLYCGQEIEEIFSCEEILGCTDEEAYNYDPFATEDDGSCEYGNNGLSYNIICDYGSNQEEVSWYIQDSSGDNVTFGGAPYSGEVFLENECYILVLNDTGGDGWNNNFLVIGDQSFTLSSGSFGYEEWCPEDISGCTDSNACNYNPDATIDNNLCEYPEQYYNCNEDCFNDLDTDGICDELDNCPYDYNPNQEIICDVTSIYELLNNKALITIMDILGRETNNKGFLQLYIYDDGSVEKRYIIE